MAICVPAAVFSISSAQVWAAEVKKASQQYDEGQMPLQRLPGRDDPQENPITFMWMMLIAAFVTFGWSSKQLLRMAWQNKSKKKKAKNYNSRELRPTLKMVFDLKASKAAHASEIELGALGSDDHRRSV